MQAAQALICAQVASNTADYTLSQWAPIYYTEVLNVPIAAVGAHLALPQIVNTVGTFAVAALQNALLAHGLPLPALRRLASSAAALLVGTSLVLFGLARRPELATASYCLLKASETLHSAGMSPNRLEVGDVDAGVLSSVVNVSATLPAYILPFLGLWIRCARPPPNHGHTEQMKIIGLRVALWLCL